MSESSTVDALASALRTRILDGELTGGTRLVERELGETYPAARHTLRAALRALAAEGLIVLIPNAGASVASLGPEDAVGLFELRTALEVEACRLALARDPGGLQGALRAAAVELRSVCEAPEPAWSAVTEAHAAVHRALVDAADSPRLAAAYATLEGEMRLFLTALRPDWSLVRMADHHDALPEALSKAGVGALREHLADGAATVLGRRGY